ncbi:hypothetical protein BDN72DRAFT_830621 [Pluteus cervinus]|uniref:Uncharacterized protein n=1 Tax=Pluteus cervinus TaxID=181527 RepID=A0ACD3BHF1_9AGAR|nr:hypothetical protein BDN72DRAFT_830621 [Pluteus cervinus]
MPTEVAQFPPPSPSIASGHTVTASAASHIPLLRDYRPSLPITYQHAVDTPPPRPVDVPPEATRSRRATLTFSLLGRKRSSGESQPSAVFESLSRWGRWSGRISHNEASKDNEPSFADAHHPSQAVRMSDQFL